MVLTVTLGTKNSIFVVICTQMECNFMFEDHSKLYTFLSLQMSVGESE